MEGICKMKRCAFFGRLKKGFEKEYIARHDNIWPELVQAYKDAGILNMTVFMKGLDLFGYYEIDEVVYDQEKDNLSKNPVEMKWQEYLAEIANRSETIEPPVEVFHM